MKNDTTQRPMVVFFQRKPRAVGNYSVEFIFEDIRKRLGNKISPVIARSAFESSGFFKRFYNCIEAFAKQGQVNHVTGDINYIGLFLRPHKTIHTILDCVFLTNASGIRYKILKLFWLSIPVKRSRFLTAISASTKREILKHISCDPDKIVVIPVAISPKFTLVPKDFNTECPEILQIGTAPNKNIPNLIQAIKGIPCVLRIIGKRDEGYEILLKSNNIKYIYEWDLTEEEIIQRYRQADIITLISTYEGFGMPILEAQATGRVVITSKILSMPEVAGEGAHFVDPFDITNMKKGFLKLIRETQYRDNLISFGLRNCERYQPDTIANKYLKLYTQIQHK